VRPLFEGGHNRSSMISGFVYVIIGYVATGGRFFSFTVYGVYYRS